MTERQYSPTLQKILQGVKFRPNDKEHYTWLHYQVHDTPLGLAVMCHEKDKEPEHVAFVDRERTRGNTLVSVFTHFGIATSSMDVEYDLELIEA